MNFRNRPKLSAEQIVERAETKRRYQQVREERARHIRASYRVTHQEHIERQRRAGIAAELIQERFGGITPNRLLGEVE